MVLDLAKRAGASYADVRIGRSQDEFIRARDRRLDENRLALLVGTRAPSSTAAGASPAASS
jgi:hypothetical protein